jgi:hypothetical protein
MRVKQVATWESTGDDAALRKALEDGSPEVRQAAASAFLRYGAYDTGRPTVLALLGKNPTTEAKEVKRKLFGVPPQTTPDPHGAGAGPGQVVIYLYRPVEDLGEARWLRIDDDRSVRLRPGRFLRYEGAVGSHQLALELPDEEVPPTDDPNEKSGQMRKAAPLRVTVSTPTIGVYFVRERAQKGPLKPDIKVMPVPPGLAAVMPLKPAERADCDGAGF